MAHGSTAPTRNPADTQMILKALTLENFKGVREPVRIEFAPLTLLFGPNNAGKSTIIQALMYAREVLERNNCDAGRTALGGDVVDLGGFANLVHGHDGDRAIRMRFELNLEPQGLPSFKSEEQREDLERREYDLEGMENWSLYKGFGLRDEFSWALGQLTDVWIEIEIAHHKSMNSRGGLNTVVRRYSVGSGRVLYATISLPEDSDRAVLSYFNFGVPPFGWTYTKGDSSDFNWDLARIVRRRVDWILSELGLPNRGLTKGAGIAFAGEPILSSGKMLSRDEFDEIVSRIVNGEGASGDETIDPETGKQSKAYQFRKEMIKQARDVASIRENRAREPKPAIDVDPEDPLGILSDDWFRVEPGLVHGIFYGAAYKGVSYVLDSTEESVGWLFQWWEELSNQTQGFELTTRGTALPDWQEGIQPYEDIWLTEEDKDFENIEAFLELGREHLIDFLSAVVVGPGKLLLDALLGSIYLGPIRKLPSRHYRPAGGPYQGSWANGLAAWDLLMTESKLPLIKAINDWLLPAERFGTGYRIEIQRRKQLDVHGPLWDTLMTGNLAEQEDAIRKALEALPEEAVNLDFVNDGTGLALAPQDLGGGISQLVPVIVAALQGAAGIIAIEEPESNIHPAFQVVLADLFMSQVRVNPELLFLVETHSEHLMLRCLRRIRESNAGRGSGDDPELAPEDISVSFVEPDDKGQPRIHRIRVDEEGEFLDPWPRGFFRERSRELYGDDL
jgi:hypothetical protein